VSAARDDGLAPGLTAALRRGLFAVGLLGPLAVAALWRAATAAPEAAAAAAPGVAARACDALRIDGEDCPEGLRCVAGSCEPLRLAARGARGDACVDGLCAAGLECFAGRCTPPEALPLAPPACRPAEVRAVIASLRRRCSDGAATSLDACEAARWQELSTRDPHFEDVLGALPGVLSVHFPVDLPDARGRWATASLRAGYLQRLAEHRASLRAARQVLVFARASLDGAREHNRQLAERRAALVVALLRELLGADAPPLRSWSLASEFPVSLERFQGNVRAAPITWSPTQTAAMTAALAGDLQRLPRAAWLDLHDAINRVVLVVPLYCDGGEYYPEPAFAGPEGSSL
jgi:hypothetical protein